MFPVPSRSAIYQAEYRAACDVNEAKFGRRLTRQCWHICGKIREADQLLQTLRPLRERLFESHPEIVFSRLSEGTVQHRKKTPEGIQQRLGVLEARLDCAGDFYEQAMAAYPRRLLARDDILDAMVLSLLGSLRLEQLTDGTDESGIPIRMTLPVTDTLK